MSLVEFSFFLFFLFRIINNGNSYSYMAVKAELGMCSLLQMGKTGQIGTNRNRWCLTLRHSTVAKGARREFLTWSDRSRKAAGDEIRKPMTGAAPCWQGQEKEISPFMDRKRLAGKPCVIIDPLSLAERAKGMKYCRTLTSVWSVLSTYNFTLPDINTRCHDLAGMTFAL